MGSRLHGNDGRTHNRHSRHGGPRRTHIVIPAQAGIHGGEGGDGFPSPLERRAHPTIVIPATAGTTDGVGYWRPL